MYIKNIRLYSALLVIATLFLGIAYANISSENLYINGDAAIISNESIEIVSVSYKESYSANIENSNILNYAKTLMQSTIELESDKDAYITFTVIVKNNTSKDLYYIDTIKSDDFYTNSNNELNTQLIYETYGINKYDKIDKNGGQITFDITFKYDEAIEEIQETNQVLNSYLNFRFREVYSITYNGIANNNYVEKLVNGEEYTITFVDDIPENVMIIGDVSSSYINGVLTLTDINSDVVVLREGFGGS